MRRTRKMTVLLFLSALCACSSSSSAGSPSGAEGGQGQDSGQTADSGTSCSGKPESNSAGSCLFYGLAAADAGDGGAPLIFCTDYTGSGMTAAGSVGACKTSLGVAAATCPTTATVIGTCILSCGTSFETVQYYYDQANAVPAQQQCESSAANYWVP
jgi:hypothetical protein